MNICSECGKEYPDDVSICPDDGTILSSGKKQDPFIGKTIDDKYRISEKLGGGGMGAVYKGTHLLMNRTVAVKVLHSHLAEAGDDDEFLRRFQREARTASQINHPNAIAIYDFGIENNTPYLVMEFNEGRSLKQVFAEDGSFSLERTTNIMAQVCGAIEEAHALGIVHRDLKPDNIMISEKRDGSDHASVLDFGIAKILSGDGTQGTVMTKTGGLIGTPRYMSPQQALGEELDARSDIYSMGIILYEMLTGNVPFYSDSAMQLILKHINELPKPVREFEPDLGVPDPIADAVMKALEKKPEDRQQTIGEFLGELQLNGSKQQAAAAPAAKREKPAKAQVTEMKMPELGKSQIASFKDLFQKNKIAVSGAAAAVVIVVGAIFIFSGSDAPSVPSESFVQQTETAPVVKTEEAEEAFQRALELHKNRDWENAAAVYEEAIAFNPGHAKAHANLGDVYISLEQLDKAEQLLARSVELDSENVTAHANLGYVLDALGKHEQALTAYQETIRIKPDYALGYNNVGFAFFKLGRMDEAETAYKKSLQLDPNYGRAYYNLADVYEKEENWDKVITAYKLGLKVDPDNSAAHNHLGEVYEKLNRVKEAIAEYGKAARLDPNAEAPRKNLGRLSRSRFRG